MSAAVAAIADEVVDALLDREDVLDRLAAKLTERQPEGAGGWLRGADRIAKYIDAPPSRVYALVSAGRLPIHRDGSALIAKTAELDRWIEDGGGLRP